MPPGNTAQLLETQSCTQDRLISIQTRAHFVFILSKISGYFSLCLGTWETILDTSNDVEESSLPTKISFYFIVGFWSRFQDLSFIHM